MEKAKDDKLSSPANRQGTRLIELTWSEKATQMKKSNSGGMREQDRVTALISENRSIVTSARFVPDRELVSSL